MTKRRALLLAVTIAAATHRAAAAERVDRLQMTLWLRQLADVNPAVRDAVRIRLMGLSETDLGPLHDTLVAMRPLRPAQVEAMHDIVTHVLTRAAMLQFPVDNITGRQAFLGVVLQKPGQVDVNDGGDEDDVPIGVPLVGVLPGFAAARVLEDSDVILGFGLSAPWLWGRPRSRLMDFGPAVAWVRSKDQLSDFVSRLRPGTPLTLLVERTGRTFAFPILLDARPNIIGVPQPLAVGLQLNNFAEQAVATAEQQFIDRFGDVLGLDKQ